MEEAARGSRAAWNSDLGIKTHVERVFGRGTMECMIEPSLPATPPNGEPVAPQEALASGSTSADETGQASFPASDPPAVWTWEVDRKPPKSVAD